MPRLKSPKAKGDAYERELAAFLDAALFNASGKVYRAPLSGGGRTFSGGGSADLVGLPLLWPEAKRTERFQPYDALAQAERGRDGHRSGELPAIFTRRNNMKTGESLVTMRLDDWLLLYESFLRLRGFKTSPAAPPSHGTSPDITGGVGAAAPRLDDDTNLPPSTPPHLTW